METYLDHRQGYSNTYIREILTTVRTIALVGASADSSKPSHQVLRFLHASGYDMVPVNPRPDVTEILGLRVYRSLDEIDRPIDMVDVFRPSAALLQLAHDAVRVKAKVLWAQNGVFDEAAAQFAEAGGLKVVMDRCPKIELTRPELRLQVPEDV